MATRESIDDKYRKNMETIQEFDKYTNYPMACSIPLATPKIIVAMNSSYPNELDQFNHILWINNNDFSDQDENDDEILIQTQVTSLFEEILYIINEFVVDETDLDNNFRSYLKLSSDGVQVVMNQMFEKKWNFNPMDKFMWIYVMLACKYEPRALKYLVNSPYFMNYSLTLKDKNGYSPLYHGLLNENLDITLLTDVLTIENLKEIYFNGHPLINCICRNTKNFMYIVDNIPEILNDNYQNAYHPFVMACIYNEEIAKYIFDKSILTPDIINKTDLHGITCLMFSLAHTPNIFKLLFESHLCNQNIINYLHPIHGNVLMLALSKQPNLVNYILDSKYANTELLNGKIRFASGNETNVLLESLDNIELFSKIINHSKFSGDILNNLDIGKLILQIIANKNVCAFTMLLTKNIINANDLIEVIDDLSILFFAAFHSVGILDAIFDLGKWDSSFLQQTYKSTCKNIIMLLLERSNDSNKQIIKNFIYKLYDANILSSDVLKHNDNGFYNTFIYLCIYFPELAKEIILKNDNLCQYITPENLRLFCYHLSFGNIQLLDILFLSKVVSISDINLIDTYGNNVLMESCIYDIRVTEKIIKYQLFDVQTIGQLNTNKDNILNLMLRYPYYPHDILNRTLEIILTSECINETILNNLNVDNEFPFLLACHQNHDCVKLILDSKYFDISNFTINTTSGNNCFAYACKSDDFELIKILCDHPLFTEEMFTACDSSNIPYIYHSMTHNTGDITMYILNHKFCNEKILKESYKLLLHRDTLIINALPYILDSKLCSMTILSETNQEGNNCLIISVKKNRLDVVEKLLSSTYFSKELFSQTNINGDTCFSFVNTIQMADILLKSEYFDKNIFSIKNKNDSNIINKLIMHENYAILSKILESKKYNIDALKCVNVTEKCAISNLFVLPEGIINLILSNESLTKNDLCTQDSYGNTCLHTYAANLEADFTNSQEPLTLEFINENFCDKLDKFNKYLNLDIFSETLLECVNDGNYTFLQINPYLLGVTLDSKYCTKKLLKNFCKDGHDILIELYQKHKSYLPMLLNNKLFDSSFLIDEIESKQCLNMISYVCINSSDDVIDLFLNSNACTNDVVNYVNVDNYTPLMYAILTNNTFAVEKLLNSKFDLTPSFNHKNNLKNVLMLAALVGADLFRMIMNSKYTTSEMFLECDKYRHNVVIFALSRNIDIVRSIVESKYWNESLMYYVDIDNDFIMMYPYDEPEIVKYLLSSGRCTTDMLLMENNFGKNCSHYYARHNTESFIELLNSELCVPKVVMAQDILGDTCLHAACQYNINSVKKMLHTKYYNESLILLQNNNGMNPLMVSLKHNPQISLKMGLPFINNENLLWQKDYEGNTILFYAVRYNLKLMKLILKSKVCNNNYLSFRNKNNMTCYMYAAQFNGEALKYLMNVPDITDSLLYSNHLEYGSCLTIAARYQPIGVKYILDWKGLTWKLLNTMDNNFSFLSIACMYNAESVKYILESGIDLKELFGYSDNSPLVNACRYQPEAVKYILDSKYATNNMLLERNGNRTCVDEAFDLQPKSLLYIMKSKFANANLLDLEDERGYKLLYRIKHNYPQFNSIADIQLINLTHYDNELANEHEKKCDICYTFKQNVLLLPCYHMCCVGCAFKLSKCHQCRSPINDKKVLYG